MNLNELKTNLRAKREAAGLSIFELAKAAGVSPRSVSYIEDTGANFSPRFDTLKKIAAALGCKLEKNQDFKLI